MNYEDVLDISTGVIKITECKEFQEYIDECLERMKAGEDPEKIFDSVIDLYNNHKDYEFKVVELRGKYNLLTNENTLVSPTIWFDYVEKKMSKDCCFPVRLHHNWNLLDVSSDFSTGEGKLLSPNLWFEEIVKFESYPYNYQPPVSEFFPAGFCKVRIKGKYNLLTREGTLLSPYLWFDNIIDLTYFLDPPFSNTDYCVVELEDKCNLLTPEGKLLSPELWFDNIENLTDDDLAFYFYDYCKVTLNGKCNLLTREGNILFPNLWFDDLIDITNEMCVLELNGKLYHVTYSGEIIRESYSKD